MSRYVTPASKHASKIGTLNSGSTAFSTASARVSRISATIARDARRVDGVRGEPAVVEPSTMASGRAAVVVGERAMLEEVASLCDPGERRADSTGAHDGDPHTRVST